MDFKKVEFDTDLDDMDAGELRELVREFEQAQEQNLADFAEVEGEITEFEEFDSELTADLVEQTSLSEDAASALPFSEKRELLADLNDTEEETQEDAEFEDRGKQGETQTEEKDVTPDFVKETLESVSGVQP